MADEADIFDRLFDVIQQRRSASPDSSYVARLMARGTAAINEKVLEEAAEACAAALDADKTQLARELCDLMFHAFVLAADRGVALADIRAELQRRFGISGLTRKARRGDA